MLAVLNLATLLVAGHPWTVTWAFTLWGAKAAAALGWDPQSSAFWTSGFPGAALQDSVLHDNISIWTAVSCWARCLPPRSPAASRRA
jgi:hypothetical protein